MTLKSTYPTMSYWDILDVFRHVSWCRYVYIERILGWIFHVHWMYISDTVFIEILWIVFRHVSWCIYVYIERILDGFQHRHRIPCIGLYPFGDFGLYSAMLSDAYIFILNIFWANIWFSGLCQKVQTWDFWRFFFVVKNEQKWPGIHNVFELCVWGGNYRQLRENLR